MSVCANGDYRKQEHQDDRNNYRQSSAITATIISIEFDRSHPDASISQFNKTSIDGPEPIDRTQLHRSLSTQHNQCRSIKS
jgi:hypothetical protein